MAERVCSRALGKTISKTVAKPREYTRANRSSSFRAERERDRYGSETNTRGGASGEGNSRDLCARSVKSVRAPAPGIFPDFQFICRHKARMPAAAVDNGRETRNDRVEMQALPIVIGPVPCCPSDTGGGARFLSNFKHPWNIRRFARKSRRRGERKWIYVYIVINGRMKRDDGVFGRKWNVK